MTGHLKKCDPRSASRSLRRLSKDFATGNGLAKAAAAGAEQPGALRLLDYDLSSRAGGWK